MKYYISLIFLFYSTLLFAQLEISSLRPQSLYELQKAKRLNQSADTLAIPFFDDFSQYTGNPDTLRWESGSGAFVTVGLGIFPPSKGVLSFDGLNEFGNPYDFRSNFPKGTADVLSALPIDLSPWEVNEDISLSFFWQQAGLGEAPDQRQGDSLIVEFKIADTDSTFKWKVVWGVEASDSLPNDTLLFTQINLDDSAYFYNSFQFRIRNRGTLSGNYDNWIIDYVVLNRNGTDGPRFPQDRTIQTREQRVFKDFTSIPIEQINTDSLSNYFMESSEFYVRTLLNKSSVYAVQGFITEENTNTIIQDDTIIGGLINQGEIRTGIGSIDKVKIDEFPIVKNQYYTFEKSYILFDHDDTIYEGIDRRINDSTEILGHLAEYYAYDDATPELGAGIRTPFGKVAIEYGLYAEDTMTGLDIMFIPGESSITSTQIGIRIWSDLQKDVDPIIYGQDIVGGYGQGKYSFFRVNFDSAVIVSDTIYIGWVQFDKTFLNVGYDMNNRFNDKIYTKIDPDEGWVNESDFEFPGALMIRPIFDTVNVPIAKGSQIEIKEEEDTEERQYEVTIGPNPAKGFISIVGECDEFFIYDLNGRMTISGNQLTSGDKINLSELSNGSYIIKFVNDGMLKNKRLQIFR